MSCGLTTGQTSNGSTFLLFSGAIYIIKSWFILLSSFGLSHHPYYVPVAVAGSLGILLAPPPPPSVYAPNWL